jgi:hypothetical protein
MQEQRKSRLFALGLQGNYLFKLIFKKITERVAGIFFV